MSPEDTTSAEIYSGRRFGGVLLLLGAGVMLFFLVSVSLGSVPIPLGEVVRVLLGGEAAEPAWTKIIRNLRLPRAFTAVMAGSALSVAGLQMQTLFRNPLAGPSVLGITAGASLGVAAVMLAAGSVASVFAIQQLGSLQSWLIIGAASLGSFLVLLLILAISAKVQDNVTLLILGLMIGNITIALVSVWQYFSQPEQIRDYLIWTFGSLGGVPPGQIGILLLVTLSGTLMAFGLSKSLNGLLLGENYARSMGIPVRRTRYIVIVSTSLLAGGITAFCGPIGFVGIAVPHLARSALNTNDHKVLIPATLVTGALLMLICDIVAQVPGSATTLPISAVTSMVGSPVVIWVILKRRNLGASF
ncbi:MAG: iron ABC transporter permease [Balneolaceae bacterium]|nr:iron ABC transporter permease [Balneolaceae bacterium]